LAQQIPTDENQTETDDTDTSKNICELSLISFPFIFSFVKHYLYASCVVKEINLCLHFMGGAVASWLAHSTPDQVVQVRALAGDIVMSSWVRHFTLTVRLSTQVYNGRIQY